MAVNETFGYWSAWVAPLPRIINRFPVSKLVDRLKEASVALRGWDYPHTPRQKGALTYSQEWVQARTSAMQYEEIWRFHADGLFTHRWRMREEGTQFRGTIHFVAAIYSVAEIWEFAKRLYGQDDLVKQMRVSVRLDNVYGRAGSGDSFHDLPYGQQATRNSAEYAATLPRVDVFADVGRPAVQTAVELFHQLGFTELSERFIRERAEAFLSGRI